MDARRVMAQRPRILRRRLVRSKKSRSALAINDLQRDSRGCAGGCAPLAGSVARATSWWKSREARLGAELKFNRARDRTCYGAHVLPEEVTSGTRASVFSSRAPVLLPLVPGGGRRALPAYAVLCRTSLGLARRSHDARPLPLYLPSQATQSADFHQTLTHNRVLGLVDDLCLCVVSNASA